MRCSEVSKPPVLGFNSLRQRQNGRHLADEFFQCIYLTAWISMKISMKFVPKSLIDNMPASVQIMAWRRTGDKPLSDPMMTQFTDAYIYIYINRLQWPKWIRHFKIMRVSNSDVETTVKFSGDWVTHASESCYHELTRYDNVGRLVDRESCAGKHVTLPGFFGKHRCFRGYWKP